MERVKRLCRGSYSFTAGFLHQNDFVLNLASILSLELSLYPNTDQHILYKREESVINSFTRSLKGHSQLMHIRISYHFLADLHITRRT